MAIDPFKLTMRMAKASFFDRKAVTSRLERQERGLLSKAGAFVRTKARSLIRRIKRPARPGEPPRARFRGQPSLKTILFVYEPRNHGVVIGPVKFGSMDAPRKQEFGAFLPKPAFVRSAKKRSGRKSELIKIKRIAKHPFMGPALEDVQDRIPKLWRGSVRG